MKSFLLKYALIPLTATMFALWYFSLAMDELRKRFPFLDRIVAYFTGHKRSIQANVEVSPADKPQPPVDPEDDSGSSEKLLPAPVEPSKPAELPKPKPVPGVEPVKPLAAKVEVAKPTPTPISPAPSVPEKTPSTPAPKTPVVEPARVKPAPTEEPSRPEPASKAAPTLPKPSPPVESPKPKDLVKPDPAPAPAAAAAAPTPAPTPSQAPTPAPTSVPAPARLVKEKKELPSPAPQSAPAATPATETVLPANNEDSFIIVEQQKPAKPAPTKPKVDLKSSTMDFLQSEGGGVGRPIAPPSPANR